LVKVSILLACVTAVIINPPENAFPVLAVLVVAAFAVGIIRSLRRSAHEEQDDVEGEIDETEQPVVLPRGGRR